MKRVTDTLGVSRSAQYDRQGTDPVCRRGPYHKAGDAIYGVISRSLVEERPTYGYRRITAVLNRQLRAQGKAPVNHKRVYRIMKAAGLLLQRCTGQPSRMHDGRIITDSSNARWCSDVFEIPCDNGQRVRVAFSMDCCDREVLSYVATTGGISGDEVRDLMVDAVQNRFGSSDTVPTPVEWLSDNGSAYVSHETRAFARLLGLEVCRTPYHSPESNGMAESFVKTFKRDYVGTCDTSDPVTVMEQLPTWFEDYNEHHPHKGLKMRSPREFRRLKTKLEECPV